MEGVLQELAKYGAANVRHAHGNWNGPQRGGWIEKLHANAIRPVQQFAYTTGKNATDASMIIDAMDLLYSGNVDAFALMTIDRERLAAVSLRVNATRCCVRMTTC
ncbi:NYN domain-containing protein [Marinobacter changyiensis]|uniref:NYN domain-containing protein n=1 Tax=Marinobacter changyiensis TaxID=2604091 RepID=UPI001FE9927D